MLEIGNELVFLKLKSPSKKVFKKTIFKKSYMNYFLKISRKLSF